MLLSKKSILLAGLLCCSCCLMASMQQVLQQLNHAVLPLIRLNADTVHPMLYPQLTQLIGAIGKKHSITKEEFEAISKAFTQACENLGKSIVSDHANLSNGRFANSVVNEIPLIDGNFEDLINENGKWTQLPAFLNYTKNLTYLDLSFNTFAPRETFAALSTMHQLKTLFIMSGRYSEPINHLPDLSQTQLIFLDVSSNHLTLNQVIAALGKQAPFIEQLYLSDTSVTEQELPLLAPCQALHTLYLSGLNLTALPEVFSQLVNLQYLDLSFNKFTQKGLSILPTLKNLILLSLDNNNLTEIPNLNKLPALNFLNLRDNHLSVDAKTYLQQLKKDNPVILIEYDR